jgi:hypothetical protein
VVIDDPFPDPSGLREPSRSPSPVVVKNGEFQDGYLSDDVDIHTMA